MTGCRHVRRCRERPNGRCDLHRPAHAPAGVLRVGAGLRGDPGPSAQAGTVTRPTRYLLGLLAVAVVTTWLWVLTLLAVFRWAFLHGSGWRAWELTALLVVSTVVSLVLVEWSDE